MSNALELLYDNLLKKEEQARAINLATLSEEKKFEQQLNALNNYRSIYSSELNAKGFNSPLSNAIYSQYTGFINRLDNISKEQLEGLKKIRIERENKLQAYKEIEAKRKGLEHLMNKRRQEQIDKMNKQEQKLSDDLSTIKAFNREGLD